MKELSSVLGDGPIQNLRNFLSTHEEGKEEATHLIPDVAKENRTLVHNLITNHFRRKFVSDTVDGVVRIRVRAGSVTESNSERRGKWPASRGNHLHFTLLKENMDVHQSVE